MHRIKPRRTLCIRKLGLVRGHSPHLFPTTWWCFGRGNSSGRWRGRWSCTCRNCYQRWRCPGRKSRFPCCWTRWCWLGRSCIGEWRWRRRRMSCRPKCVLHAPGRLRNCHFRSRCTRFPGSIRFGYSIWTLKTAFM